MRFPIIITQKDLSVAYRSAEPVSADACALRAALKEPVYLNEDTLLTGKPVTAGYAFYTEDVSELHRMNEKLAEANDLIASENDLIQAENDLSARRAAVKFVTNSVLTISPSAFSIHTANWLDAWVDIRVKSKEMSTSSTFPCVAETSVA